MKFTEIYSNLLASLAKYIKLSGNYLKYCHKEYGNEVYVCNSDTLVENRQIG